MSWITAGELIRYRQLGDLPEAHGMADQSDGTRILLLYSRREQPLAESAVNFLKSHGVGCRIDSMQVEPEQAPDPAEIKWQIQSAHKVVIVTGNDAFRSSWMPWFLAYVENFKIKDNIALLPVADDKNYWLGDANRPEYGYFGFYPRIGKYVQGYWCIMQANQQGEQAKISHWLRKVAPEPLKAQPVP